MLRRPSISFVSLVTAASWLRVSALSTILRFVTRRSDGENRSSTVRASSIAYQTSRWVISEYLCIHVRYEPTAAMVTTRAAASSMPFSWQATNALAASRFTSHSNGPGQVSSKSLRSNTSVRSGLAKTPKLSRCASPQSCTVIPAEGVVARS